MPNSGILPELLTSPGKFVFEFFPGSVDGWEVFPDFKIAGTHPRFLDELLSGHDDFSGVLGWVPVSA